MKNSAGNRLRASARFSLIALVGLALAGGAAAVRGQSALDGFDPNANGTVSVVVVQPDGKILIGGLLTTVLAVAAKTTPQWNPAGRSDPPSTPNPNRMARQIPCQPEGRL